MISDGADNPVAQSFYTRLMKLIEAREAKQLTPERFHEELVELLKERAVAAMVPIVAYARAVGEEIGKEKALRILGQVYNGLAEQWVKDAQKQLGIGNDALAAKDLYWQFLSLWYEGQMIPVKGLLKWERVPESNSKRVHVVDTSWCSILEARKVLGHADTDDFCNLLVPCQNTDLFRKHVNPKLEHYQYKTRPQSDVCEEAFELKD